MGQNNNIAKISQSVADDYKKAFDNHLVSVILYGSALSDDYAQKKSDLNFLIVLSEEGIDQLHLSYDIAARWRKKKVSTPLFLTKQYIESSLDTFPVEFINIKHKYSVIYGEDVLSGLSFDKEFVRIQCEKELKGKLLLLRERYVETCGKARTLIELIGNSVSTFVFIFNGLLYLKDKAIPDKKQETIRMVAEDFNVDQDLFLSLLQIKTGSLKPSSDETGALFRKYLSEIRKLSMSIDTLNG
jgi:hypothetical protein